MIGTTAEENVQAKKAYGRFLGTVGVRVRGYREDNGRLTEKPFKRAVD